MCVVYVIFFVFFFFVFFKLSRCSYFDPNPTKKSFYNDIQDIETGCTCTQQWSVYSGLRN